LYHEKCLKDCLKGKKECPQCRKPATDASVHQIFLEIDQGGVINELVLTRINDVASSNEKHDEKNATMFQHLTDSLEKIATTTSAFEAQNEHLRKENNELKQMLKAIENDKKMNSVSKNDASSLKDEMKNKDFVIATLQKEVTDLKAQRAETTREMNSIREQINSLKQTAKGERVPLKDKNDQKSQPQTLTLKFDDFSDKLIIE